MATGNWRVATLSHRGELAKMFYYRLSTRSLAICITKFHIIRVLCPVIFAITRLASFLSRLPPLNTYDWAPRRAASEQIPENVFNFRVLPHNSSAPCRHSLLCWSFNEVPKFPKEMLANKSRHFRWICNASFNFNESWLEFEAIPAHLSHMNSRNSRHATRAP